VLNALLRGHAPEALSSIAGAKVSPKSVIDFICELEAHGLVAQDELRMPAPLDSAIRATVKQLLDDPSLEIHDDLADLIIADPIHDTDEAIGWPARKAA
jgi:hypothetical protein